jgi:hypothetical protein
MANCHRIASGSHGPFSTVPAILVYLMILCGLLNALLKWRIFLVVLVVCGLALPVYFGCVAYRNWGKKTVFHPSLTRKSDTDGTADGGTSGR